MNDLHRLIVYDGESRAHDFMARDQLIDDAFHQCHIEPALDPARAENVVSRVAGLQLLDKPKSFLIDRSRKQVDVFTRASWYPIDLWCAQSFRFERCFKERALLRTECCYSCCNICHKTCRKEAYLSLNSSSRARLASTESASTPKSTRHAISSTPTSIRPSINQARPSECSFRNTSQRQHSSALLCPLR